MIYIVALGGGFKCLRKIHLNTQWGGGVTVPLYTISSGGPFQLYLSSDFAIGGFASSFINCSLISSEMLLVKTA